MLAAAAAAPPATARAYWELAVANHKWRQDDAQEEEEDLADRAAFLESVRAEAHDHGVDSISDAICDSMDQLPRTKTRLPAGEASCWDDAWPRLVDPDSLDVARRLGAKVDWRSAVLFCACNGCRIHHPSQSEHACLLVDGFDEALEAGVAALKEGTTSVPDLVEALADLEYEL
jgi:hypothetical protein